MSLAILTDTTKCIGCSQCAVACKKVNHLPPDLPRRWDRDDGLSAQTGRPSSKAPSTPLCAGSAGTVSNRRALRPARWELCIRLKRERSSTIATSAWAAAIA